LGIAAKQLALSVAAIHAIEIAWNASSLDVSPAKSAENLQSTPYKTSRKKAGFALHPTTILGIQAVLATGLAMLAAFLLKFDHPNLVYWTAFVVIAGSTGESLRRMTMRIFGVIMGTVIGVLLAVVLPNSLSLIALLVALCVFMTIYSITISYIWMVFWLNIAVMLVITTLGGSARDLVILRSVSTLLGAAIAALVVVFVLPIHVENRFRVALSEFLRAADCYIETFIVKLVSAPVTGELRAEGLLIDTSYKKLELSLPNVAYEYNPLSRAQNRLADQATSLAVLKGYVTHLEDDVAGEPGILMDSKMTDLIKNIQSQIHTNVDALISYLTEGQGAGKHALSDLRRQTIPEITLEEILTAEAGSEEAVRNRAIYHMARIHDTILQIAISLGAPVASS
jgi:hypothetical protein